MLLMAPTSVILPDLSTAELPDDPVYLTGHSTGMNLQAILKRIEKRLKATGLTADGAAKAAGKPDAIRNMKRAIKAGRKGMNTDTIGALAPVLGTTSAWLIDAEGPETTGEMRSEDVAANLHEAARPQMVKLKGYVGASGEAVFYRLADEDLEEVEAPMGSSDQTVAVEIKGKSFGPLMNTWLVFYDDVRSPITPDLFNQVCVVGLADDRILIKQIKPNGRGGFDLHPNSTTDDVIKDAQIEWAAKVNAMRPR